MRDAMLDMLLALSVIVMGWLFLFGCVYGYASEPLKTKDLLPQCQKTLAACDSAVERLKEHVAVLEEANARWKEEAVRETAGGPTLLVSVAAGALGGALGGYVSKQEGGLASGAVVGGVVGLAVGLIFRRDR